jgi:HSP20 family protein
MSVRISHVRGAARCLRRPRRLFFGTRLAMRRAARRLTMANIEIKKNGPTQQAQQQAPAMARWEPSRWMSRALGWDPFGEMRPFFDERTSFEPAFEVKETKEGYLFKADVPGIKESDIDVSLRGNRLTINGKREEEKEDKSETYYTYERTYGTFTRSFTLPDDVNAAMVRADLKDGVLTIDVPKKPEAIAKKIPIAAPPAAKKA